MKSSMIGWMFLGLCAGMAYARPSAACGGTFCDGGPRSMPVDQTGENVLFVMGEDFVEAHVQIQYDPNTTADDFAWVIPLQSLPEFAVGSEILFGNLLAATVPTYGFSSFRDQCGPPSTTMSTSSGSSTTGGSGGEDGGFGVQFDASSPPPEVILREIVGAFEITVLKGGTAEEVLAWLDDNGYQQDPEAEPILAEYLAEDFMFAAFKLRTGADVASIHPIVLRFEGREACVPLRLTRIAAKEDMEVRTFFLAEARVAPRNYRHVQVNPLVLDWLRLASNYKDVVTLAVDGAGADGKAFVTEYAGPSTAVSSFGLASDAWDPVAFADVSPVQAIDLLSAQGLLYCFEVDETEARCQHNHPLLRGILLQYLPPPPDFAGTPETFWTRIRDHVAEIDAEAWDVTAFADALAQRIVDPGRHAVELLATWPYLTRMYTTISPGEMTEDPLFWENPDLLEVPRRRDGTLRILCSSDRVFTLPDGREVFLPQGTPWPTFPDEMPWVEDVEAVTQAGGPMNLVDNTATIDLLLSQWNRAHGWPRDDEGGTASGGSGEGGDSSEGGTAGQYREDDGCGCTTRAHGLPALVVSVAFASSRRKRRC